MGGDSCVGSQGRPLVAVIQRTCVHPGMDASVRKKKRHVGKDSFLVLFFCRGICDIPETICRGEMRDKEWEEFGWDSARFLKRVCNFLFFYFHAMFLKPLFKHTLSGGVGVNGHWTKSSLA